MALNPRPVFTSAHLAARRLAVPFAMGLLLMQAACGGSDAPIATAAPVAAQMRALAEPPGAHCSAGGFRFDLGADVDRSNQLEAAEVQATAYACPSADTDTVLASVSNASAGACPAGATALRVGIDANQDGVLQDTETTATVCVDSPPAAPRLVKLSGTAPANVCPFGGRVLALGEDANRNGVLDGDELASSTPLCRQDSATPLAWADAGSTAVQATSNAGYRALSDTETTVITLPPDLAVGDVVAVSGAGAAGWRIAQNAGQSINAQSLGRVAGQTWTTRDEVRPWVSVSSSADGRRLLASTSPGRLYTSDDAGLTWTPRDAEQLWEWGSSSADGTRLAISEDSGYIHISTDAGITWSTQGPVGVCFQTASSADGQRLAAVGSGQPIQVSTDGGLHWQASGPALGWYSVAMSGDGQTVWAAAHGASNISDYLYVSTDGGSTWAPRSPPSTSWEVVAVSADGRTVLGGEDPGSLYLSVDGGSTWSPTPLPQGAWYGAAASSDGRTLLVAEDGGMLYTSYDRGATWTSGVQKARWTWVALSADGTRMAATATDRQIYTSSTWTTVGPTGSLSGGAADAVLLQYTGEGNFVVLRHTGTVGVQ